MQVNAFWQATGSQAEWRHTLVLGISLLAVLLAGSALVFWVAANWPRMGPQTRLWLAQGVLALVVLLAAGLALRGSRWAGLWAGFAALLSGALLALVGQIYQTGVDRWQMFLLWAVLVTPWVVLFRTVFLVSLWVCLLNLALWLWAGGRTPSEGWLWLDVDMPLELLALLLLNAGLLALAECLQRFFHDPWYLVRRVLVLLLLGASLMLALQGAWSIGDADWVFGAIVSLLFTTGLVGIYRYWRTDLAVVALSLLAGIGVVGTLLLSGLDSIGGVLGVALLLLVLMWLAVRYMLRLQQALRGSVQGSNPEASPTWHLTLLRAGAMMPVVLLLGIWLAISFDLESATEVLGVGIVLLLAGVGMARWTKLGAEISAVLAVLGLLLCAGAALFLMEAPADRFWQLAVLLLSGGLVYALVPQFAVRLIAASLVLFAGLWVLVVSELGFDGHGDRAGLVSAWLAVRLWGLLFLGTGLWVWAMASDRSRLHAGQPVLWWPLAWALMGMAAAVALSVQITGQAPQQVWPMTGQLSLLLCAALPGLLLAAWMASARPALPQGWRIGVPLAILLAGLGWLMIPALSVALGWLVLGRLSGRRGLQVLAVPLGLAGLFAYYQSSVDGLTLLDKAVVLGALGLWLAGLALALQRWPQGVGTDQASPGHTAGHGRQTILAWAGYRALGVLAGGVLVLGLIQTQVTRYESILTGGHPVILALVPVDPRSLMQGDYMALDYAVRQSADDWLRVQPRLEERGTGHGWLLLRPDAQGVWQLQQVLMSPLPGQRALSGASADHLVAESLDTVAVAVRWTDGRMDFGASSWFFPEGQDSHYAAARYGLLRVADDGTALLAGLLDKDQQPL
ncbi:GDYXXLXY domain-containing protein [Castellaniella sp.]|uniref:GDYXXLXY domain-containing protein n=1 Tax=Castellaniella sp. TaxID=1955812 RepID=UPI002AFE2380|nr:GDYXXLXY domain-containing protein [Castellaniella sp.]